MSHTENRISDEMAEQILAEATKIYQQASRIEQAAERSAREGFSHGELKQACIEADIPVQYLDQAVVIIQENRSRLEQQKIQHQQDLINRRKQVRQRASQILRRSRTIVSKTVMDYGLKAIGSGFTIYCIMGIGDYFKLQSAGLKRIADKETEIVALKQTLEQRSNEITQQTELKKAHENERKIYQESKDRYQAQVKVLNEKISRIESQLTSSQDEATRLSDMLKSKREITPEPASEPTSETTSETIPKPKPETSSSTMTRSQFRSIILNRTAAEVIAAIGEPSAKKRLTGVLHWTYYLKTREYYGQPIDLRVTVKIMDDRVIGIEFD